MFKFLKKVLQNELKGIKFLGKAIYDEYYSVIRIFLPDRSRNNKELITPQNHPNIYNLINEINKVSGVAVKEVLINPDLPSLGRANLGLKNIELSPKIINNEIKIAGIYAHELGHLKNRNLHGCLSALNIPFKAALAATTQLYEVSTLALPFMGKECYDFANNITSHTLGYLIAGAAVNAISTRIKEYQSDLYAYNKTGVRPSEHLLKQEIHNEGVVGYFTRKMLNVYSFLESGYPIRTERDLVVKIFGKKPEQNNSFVDRLDQERKRQSEKIISSIDRVN